MIKVPRLWFLGIAVLLLLSCNKESDPIKPPEGGVSPDTLVPISTAVKMVPISGGSYKPFFGSDTAIVKVAPFLIDARPVTNAEFLRFVKANQQWRRSRVKALFADTAYLYNWENDTMLPLNSNPEAPVCNVSWFAAKAFAKSVSKRLPKLDEWEFVAMADEQVPNARSQKSYSDDIVNLYLEKDRQFNIVAMSKPNYWGVYNMFDLVWEWTDDFNSVLTTGDSREVAYDNKGLFCAGGATSANDIMNYAAFMRFGFRASLKANYTVSNLGFRCAKDSDSAILPHSQ